MDFQKCFKDVFYSYFIFDRLFYTVIK